MDLHGQIMNLPGSGGLSEIGTTHGEQLAYKRGHRDARHAAAELVLGVDATTAEQMRECLRALLSGGEGMTNADYLAALSKAEKLARGELVSG